MTYKQLIAHFRTLSKAAQALGLERQTVHAWSGMKRIPSMRQLKIANLTGMKADRKALEDMGELPAARVNGQRR